MMKPSLGFGLVGVGALAVLTLVHQARGWGIDGGAGYLYLVGVLPNVAAAVAIPFVIMGIWADQNPAASRTAAHRWFLWLTLLAGSGLIAWEFVQQDSRRLVFDPHDIGATIAGLVLGYFLFMIVTRRSSGQSDSIANPES